MRTMAWVVVLGLMVAGGALGQDVARPEKGVLNLPLAWRNVPAAERLAALRVGEVDGDSLLIERIYGLQVNADTQVMDLALANDQIATAVQQLIKGCRTKEVKYTDDLTVEVVRAVTLREVVETIQRTLQRTKTPLGVTENEIANITRQSQEREVGVMGNGAVRGSKGHAMILAKRAAEAGAYRKLAGTMMGVQISRTTTVRDFVVASDQIAAHLAALLAGATPTRIVHNDDGSCEVTMTLLLREVIETVMRTVRRTRVGPAVTDEEWVNVTTQTQERTITATGHGAPRGAEVPPQPAVAPEPAPAPEPAAAPAVPCYEERQIIRRVIEREVGVP